MKPTKITFTLKLINVSDRDKVENVEGWQIGAFIVHRHARDLISDYKPLRGWSITWQLTGKDGVVTHQFFMFGGFRRKAQALDYAEKLHALAGKKDLTQASATLKRKARALYLAAKMYYPEISNAS